MYKIEDSAEVTHAVTYHISWRAAIAVNAHYLCNSVKRWMPQAIENLIATYEQLYPQKLGNHHHSTRERRYGKKKKRLRCSVSPRVRIPPSPAGRGVSHWDGSWVRRSHDSMRD